MFVVIFIKNEKFTKDKLESIVDKTFDFDRNEFKINELNKEVWNINIDNVDIFENRHLLDLKKSIKNLKILDFRIFEDEITSMEDSKYWNNEFEDSNIWDGI